MIEVVPRPKKRIFLALLLLSLSLVGFLGYGFWRISLPGLLTISTHLPYILAISLCLVFLIIGIGVIGTILAIMGFPTLRFFRKLAWSAINTLFPLAIFIGKIFDINRERIERSFIEVSNHLVRRKLMKIKPEQLLVITPHCLQWSDCPYKITRDINNCHQCGKCQVGDLLAMSRRLGFQFAVVTGGTLARQTVKNVRPKALLAIACERDLTSGIQDVFPLPVLGVLNQRPCGPCCNTRVNLAAVEEAICKFIDCEEPVFCKHVNFH